MNKFKKTLAFCIKLCIVVQCREETCPILKEKKTLEYCSIVDMIRLTVVEEESCGP